MQTSTRTYSTAVAALANIKPTCTLSFSPLTLDTIPLVAPLLQRAPWRTCDYSVGGIYMWVDYFNYEYCIYRNTLFICGLDENDRRHPAFAVPVGDLPLSESVGLLQEYCDAHNCRLLFSAVPRPAVQDLLNAGATQVELLDSWGDYLYDALALATLEGKAYNKKRNHVNRFMQDNPDWRLEELNESNLAETMSFLADLPVVEKADEAEAQFERDQCARVLDYYGCYGFEGAVLRGAGGHIVAFSCAEVIGDTAVIHIEKMDHNVSGAGESINRLFAQRLLERHSQLRYLNREDDAGDPGLRRAKESYHPVEILAKFNVGF